MPTRTVQEVLRKMTNPTTEQYLFTLGGRVRCIRCNATSKRTKQQCEAPAIKGKSKCRFHGGRSTGPMTQTGREKCADVKTKNGNERRKARTQRSEAFKRMKGL